MSRHEIYSDVCPGILKIKGLQCKWKQERTGDDHETASLDYHFDVVVCCHSIFDRIRLYGPLCRNFR